MVEYLKWNTYQEMLRGGSSIFALFVRGFRMRLLTSVHGETGHSPFLVWFCAIPRLNSLYKPIVQREQENTSERGSGSQNMLRHPHYR